MSYCLNPNCQVPENSSQHQFCQSCGSKLLLRERYRAIKKIGQGGFGKTFLAVDNDKPSKPPCVIKQFFPSSQGTNSLEKAAELFNEEAMRLEELGKHSQIPALLAHFEQEGNLYLVQEYIRGDNLAQELEKEGIFSEAKIRELLIGLLPVVQFVHENNVIHRDIKPENIIRHTPSFIKEVGGDKNGVDQFFLVDFGAARYATGTAILKTGTIIGDPRYIAPEQLSGKTDFTSDLYCLGVSCLHLLTGIDTFTLFSTYEDAWIWRDYLTTSVSDELGKILDKMVQKAIKKRFQSAIEILAILNPSGVSSSISSASLSTDLIVPLSVTPPVKYQTVKQSLDELDLAFIRSIGSYFEEMSDKIIHYYRDHHASKEEAEIIANYYKNTASMFRNIQTEQDLKELILHLEYLKNKVNRYQHEKFKYRWSTGLKNILEKLEKITS